MNRISAGRIVAIAIGALLFLFGVIDQANHQLAMQVLAPLRQPGIVPIVLGLLLIGATLFEGRYRQIAGGAEPPGAGWETTGETFRDEESGQWMRVWFHRASGERRYLPTVRSSG